MFFVLFICYSCRENKSGIKEQTVLYKKYSLKIATQSEYNSLYKKTNDSVKVWVKKELGFYADQKKDKWQVDSLICFNKYKNKIVMARLVQCIENGCIAEDVHFFYGVKIREKWYFFEGGTIYLARKNYQKDIHTPLSFEKLHEIAMKEVFRGYLKKKDKGFWGNLFGKTEWEINDDFFSGLTSGVWCTDCKTQQDVESMTKEQWDDAYLKVVRENWQKLDTIQNTP